MKLKILSLTTTLAALLLAPHIASAQQEFPPPSGKGRVVVVVAGTTGASPLRQVAGQIAGMGYDAVLFESGGWVESSDKGLRDAIATAQRMPHALPGKVGLVGFSLGGAHVLAYGTALNDDVAVVAAWYPDTTDPVLPPFKDLPGWASRLKVPTVMFAGENDVFRGCCRIDKARELARTAAAAGAPLELITYSNAPHGFVLGSDSYKPIPHADAFARTKAALHKVLD
jgi:dienelactone hydrolase